MGWHFLWSMRTSYCHWWDGITTEQLYSLRTTVDRSLLLILMSLSLCGTKCDLTLPVDKATTCVNVRHFHLIWVKLNICGTVSICTQHCRHKGGTCRKFVQSVLCREDDVCVLQQAEDRFSTDLWNLISIFVFLLIVVIRCIIKFSILNTNFSFFKCI